MISPQAEQVAGGLRRILGDDLVGVYLHGSAVLECFGPGSDIDLLLVLARPSSTTAKQRVAALLLELSAPYEPPGPPRPVEVDAIAEENLRPWRYPAQLDFHYSEEFRERIAGGDLEAWDGLESRDLAAHVTVLRRAGLALEGPPVDEVFPEVPWADYVEALTHDLDWCRERWLERPRYGVLSIARIWATLATGTPQSKASGAEWALPHLSPCIRPVLEHGLAFYRGEIQDDWSGLPLDDYLATVAAEIERLPATPRR